ncbi:MAG: tetratricopeptide repeat protein [Pyrinomonadaceae bacterium]
MTSLHTQIAKNPVALAERLLRLERCGRYTDALDMLGDIWPDIEASPIVENFSDRDAAEIHLRCGSLIGLHGHNAQIPSAQERSKDLLTKARGRFLDLGLIEKVAECENHLAFAYWRTGEFNEAENWIEEALCRDLAISSDARLYSYLIRSLINLAGKRHEENVVLGSEIESSFRKYGDAFLSGSFYTNIGLSLKNLGKTSEALGHFELAKYYHERSHHKIYLATVENNLAQLYKETGKFNKAHESIDNATRIFRSLKDKTREGYSLDTKALVYYTESKYSEALRTVDRALKILKGTENSAYRIDTLLTKAKILLFLNRFSEAVLSLSEAVTITRVQTGDKAAMLLIDEFESALDARNSPPKKDVETGDFELVLPQSLAHFADYRGIWITGPRLESIGLVKGSLAVVVKAPVARGDLVAVAEVESGEVSCGFYDAEFGIICLEGTEGEPQIYDEKEVSVLGKIVGVCNTGRNEEGKMIIESLVL